MRTLEELFHITQLDPDITSQDAYPDISASPTFIELFRLQVPVERRLTFKPGHTFSLLARKLENQAVDRAVSDDGGAQADDTADANDADINDMAISPATPVVGDAYYFGYRFPFNGFTVKYSTAATAGHAHAVEFWNGLAWAAVSGLTDPTNAFTAAAGTYDITFTRPKNWTACAVLGGTLYWIRCRVTAVPATPTGCSGDQAWIHPDPTYMEDTDKVRVEIRSQNELERKPLINEAMYSVVDEFTDRDLMYRLDISEPVIAEGGFWVVILVKAKAPIGVSNCYFDLTCDRTRQAII